MFCSCFYRQASSYDSDTPCRTGDRAGIAFAFPFASPFAFVDADVLLNAFDVI